MNEQEEYEAAEKRFDEMFDKGELDDDYADYLTRVSDARISNGTMLIEAMEKFVQFEGFKEWSLA